MEEKKAQILVVDDDVDLCKSLEIILKRNGYQVMTVHNGLQAVEIVQKNKFELILIDVVMPDMDGLATLKELHDITPGSRLVMMTGFSVSNLVGEAVKVGVDGVLIKPFDVDVVLNKLLKEDIVLIFEGYLQAAWARIKPVVGSLSAVLIFQRAFSFAFGEEIPDIDDCVSAVGIDLSFIQEDHLGLENEVLRKKLQKALAQVFELLEDLTGAMFTEPLVLKISENLKAD